MSIWTCNERIWLIQSRYRAAKLPSFIPASQLSSDMIRMKIIRNHQEFNYGETEVVETSIMDNILSKDTFVSTCQSNFNLMIFVFMSLTSANRIYAIIKICLVHDCCSSSANRKKTRQNHFSRLKTELRWKFSLSWIFQLFYQKHKRYWN